ncbi:MBL fold metallo-hydrolase [Montanilutibacter psychrotolerans]|uniref:MBL fold metallo-hydrolase n=1 Tax=Montanilutibacter psychrotolerans TaxID=1327343 RepID=A0A3M8SZX1_9GAMM|nr:MBL fold metallo-hydrolase [Lysobacter psychrotolerans]RNF84430.1 MBL fold metallo-hydrolase [Lysobacter psychrotolerans]
MRCVLLLLCLLLPVDALALELPRQWVHGAAGEPALQVHEAAPGFWVLRQSKRSNAEAPFLYLIAGAERALLLDSGAEPVQGHSLPLRETVDGLLAQWARAHGRAHFPLVVAHTHAHRDHVFGDAQFRDRPDTRIVGSTAQDVAKFFGLDRWPDGEANFDLGERAMTVLPIPGHEPAHIAVYDPVTGSLFTGDSLYPGLLTIRDWPAYRASAQRLAAFAAAHRVDQVLGAHIEMTATARRMYPLGTAFQPEEHALALGMAQIDEVAATTSTLGDFLHADVHDDFVLQRIIATPPSDAPNTHGMLVVGTDVVYLSHLPMFHSPHNYQLIFEAGLSGEVLAAYRADAARHPGAVYTLAPTAQWVLPTTIQQGGSFRADLYRGHFERGGTTILSDIEVRVADVVQFRRFEPGSSPEPAQWIGFGRGSEHFLAHRLEGPPDMDQVVQVSRPQAEGRAVVLPGAAELKPGDAIPAGAVQRVIYTEYGDLAR